MHSEVMLEVTTTKKVEVTYCLTIFFSVPEALSIDVSAVRSCRANMSVLCYGWQEEEKNRYLISRVLNLLSLPSQSAQDTCSLLLCL